MRLFLNGKQHTEPLRAVQQPRQLKAAQVGFTEVGGATGSSAFLAGKVYGVRVSDVARYRKDFVPPEQFDKDGSTLALYRFDEGQGDKLTDASGNGHHGKIVGAKWVAAP